MLKASRINTIRTTLIKKGSVNSAEIAEELGVSRRTIRRDLDYLARINVAKLVYGGAKLVVFDRDKNFKKTGIEKIMNEFSFDKTQNLAQSTSEGIGVYVLGSFNVDVVSITASLPKPGQTVHAMKTRFLPGGKGSNQATAASKVIGNTHLTVKVGKDSFAETAKEYFSSSSIVSIHTLQSETEATGNALIMVDDNTGENSIAIDLGANKDITIEELDLEFPLIETSKVFLTQLENNFEITKQAIEFAQATSIVILNPAPYIPEVKQVLKMVDIITPNETEAEDLTGIKIDTLDDAVEAAKAIHSMGCRIVIITLGSNGVIAYDGDNTYHCPAFAAAVEDTSGAGDSFNGSLAAALSKGETLQTAITYASAFASLAVERAGAANMPSHNLVMDRLSLQKEKKLVAYSTK